MPPLCKYVVIPVARKLWALTFVGMPAVAALDHPVQRRSFAQHGAFEFSESPAHLHHLCIASVVGNDASGAVDQPLPQTAQKATGA